MLAIWILSVGFSLLVSGAMINGLVAPGQQTMVPQNFVPPSLNYNIGNKDAPSNPINDLVAPGQLTMMPQNLLPSLNYNIGNKGAPNNPINDLVAPGQQTMVPQNPVPPYVNYNIGNKDAPNNPINVLVAPGQLTMMPQNLLPSLNYNIGNKDASNNPLLVPFQATASPQNAANCPNTAILLNILNILTNSLPRDDKTMLEPEKFKYVLTVVKTFLEATPFNSENVELYNRFKYLEAQMDTISSPIEKPSLRKLVDKLKAKIYLQYDLPAQSNSNCQDIFNNLINFVNIAYSQVLRYCLTTEKCNIYKGDNHYPYTYNGVSQFNPNVPDTLPKEYVTARADLVNFIKIQKGKGNNIMSNLQNYRPSGVTNVPGNDLKNPNGIQNPLPHVNPESIQVPSLNPPHNQINGKNSNVQPSNIYNNPNPASWQTAFSGLKGLSGDTYENQQYVKFLAQKFYEGNNVAVSSFLYPGVKKPSYIVNGEIVPMNTGVPIADPNQLLNTNPSITKNPNLLFDPIKRKPNQEQNLLNTNIKEIQSEMAYPINKVPNFIDNNGLTNMKNLQNLLNLKIQSTMQQNIPYKNPSLPQQPFDLNQYQPRAQDVNNQLFNRYGLGYYQISPFVSYYNAKYNNGQMITDNTKQGNNGGMLDFNRLLGVANLGKLNTLQNNNGVVELTYMLKRPKPVYESQYYVKYRLPYQTFLYNLQNLLVKKPNLRNEPSHLYQDLLMGSNVTDTSKDLKGLNYEDILKLTSTNGTLVTAKILEGNDTVADQTLKIVQKLNSKLPVENIISFNVNATKNIRLETQKNLNGSKNSSDVINNNLMNNVNPMSSDVQRRDVHPQYPYNTFGQYPSRLQVNPYFVYQSKPVGYLGMPLLKYGTGLPSANFMKNPTLNPTYIANNPQFGR